MGRVAAAMIALFGVEACSFIDVKGPPSTVPHRGPIACTTDLTLPTIDAIFSVVGVGTTIALKRQADQSGRMADDLQFAYLGVPALVVGLVGAISAVYGYSTVSGCRAAKQQQQDAQTVRGN